MYYHSYPKNHHHSQSKDKQSHRKTPVRGTSHDDRNRVAQRLAKLMVQRYVPLRADKLLFHTAFNRGIPITGYLDRDDMEALSNVSKTSRASIRYVVEKRGIKLYHANFRESDFYFPEYKLWTVTFVYKGEDKTNFLKMVVRDRDDILGYINAKTFVTDIIQTKLDEFKLTFACEQKENIDAMYIVTNIRNAIERLQDHSEAYYNLSVKEIECDEKTKLGRRSKRKNKYSSKKSREKK